MQKFKPDNFKRSVYLAVGVFAVVVALIKGVYGPGETQTIELNQDALWKQKPRQPLPHAENERI